MKQLEQARRLMDPIFRELDKYDIPGNKEKQRQIIDFTVKFYARNNHMKVMRVVRKVADEFHLTLKQIR